MQSWFACKHDDSAKTGIKHDFSELSVQASRQFDKEGRKKFFTLDMNNILLEWDTFKSFITLKQCRGTLIYLPLLCSIELQVQEQPAEVRSAVYSHLEAFVPCNKEALLKRLKKLSLNIQVGKILLWHWGFSLLKISIQKCNSKWINHIRFQSNHILTPCCGWKKL